MEALQTPPLVEKGEGAEATEVAEMVIVLKPLIPPDPLLLVEGGKKERSIFQ